MAIPTALGMLVLGTSLFIALGRAKHKHVEPGLDRQIASTGTALLVTVALTCGLPILVFSRAHLEQIIKAGLRQDLQAQVRLINTVLSLRSDRAAILRTQPNAKQTLRALLADRNDPDARALLQATIDSFRPHGFTALAASLPDGDVMANSGTFISQPTLAVALASRHGTALLWHRNFYLRSEFDVYDGDQLLGHIRAEQSMPYLDEALMGRAQPSSAQQVQLCFHDATAIRCFPTRSNPAPLEFALSSKTDSLEAHAALGHEGMESLREYSGAPVIGAYAPVADMGLFALSKVQASTLYAPLRRDLIIAMLLAALAVISGSWLFRRSVRPLSQRLSKAEAESSVRRAALEKSEAFQRGVFDHAPDGILVADQDGRIVEANEQMSNLFGYPQNVLVMMLIEDLVPDRFRGTHAHHRAGFHHKPTTRPMSRDRQLRGRRADGSEFPIEVALSPMLTSDGNRVIAIIKDVTDADQKEQAIKAALKEKDLLLGEIHHRVKNNLQIVHSLLDMQAGRTLDPRSAEALRDSQNRIQSMALIHQTLYQSRDFGSVDFSRFLHTLVISLQGSYSRQDLRFEVIAEAVQLPIDRAIPCGLIINELVTNALKHAFPNGRKGLITVELRMLRGVDVLVAVSDDGVGIDEQLDLENLQSLGMQLVHLLAEQLHAELQVQRCNPTKFSLIFPPQLSQPEPA